MAVGHFDKIFDLGIDGLRLADDSVTRLRNEYAENDPIVFVTCVPYSNDDTKRLTEVCSIDTFLFRNMDVRDEVIIISDTRHFQRLCERFFCNCPTTVEHLRLWAHERTLGIPRNVDDLKRIEFADVLGAINEDQHLTRCAPVCFTGTEEDQAEQSDQETIDDVLGEQDMEEGRNFLEEADREKLIYLNRRLFPVTQSQRKKRLASWLRLPRRVRVAIRRSHRNLRHLPRQVLVQMLRANAETTETTKGLHTDSPAGDVGFAQYR